MRENLKLLLHDVTYTLMNRTDASGFFLFAGYFLYALVYTPSDRMFGEVVLFGYFLYTATLLLVLVGLAVYLIATKKHVNNKMFVGFLYLLSVPAEYLANFVGSCLLWFYFLQSDRSLKLDSNKMNVWAVRGYLIVMVLLVQVCAQFKVNFLRQTLLTHRTFYSKLDSSFESVFVVVIPLQALLIILKRNSLKELEMEYLFGSLHLAVTLLLLLYILAARPFTRLHTNTLFGTLFSIVAFIEVYRLSYRNNKDLLAHELKDFLPVLPLLAMINYGYSISRNPKSKYGLLRDIIIAHELQNRDAESDILKAIKDHFRNKDMTSLRKFVVKRANVHGRLTSIKQTQTNVLEEGTFENLSVSEVKHELILILFEDFENKYLFDPLIHYLKLEYLLLHHQSLSGMLWSLGQLKRLARGLRYRLMEVAIRSEIEKYLRGYYYSTFAFRNGSSSEDGIFGAGGITSVYETTEQKSAMDVVIENNNLTKRLVSVSRHSRLDIGYVFFYKSQLTMLIKLISSFTEKLKELLQILQESKGNVVGIVEISSQLRQVDKKIESRFAEFDVMTKKVEFIHYVAYVHHLNFNTNRYDSARKSFRLYTKRINHLQSHPDIKLSRITNDNLFVDNFYLLVESEAKNLGKIIDIYGNYHMYIDSYSEAIGKGYEMFLTPSQKHHHDKFMTHLYRQPLNEYNVLGGIFAGFLRLPGKQFVAFGHTVVKIMPYRDIDFKFIVGIKPLLSLSEDRFFILLDDDLTVEAYSYNFLQILPEEYIQFSVNLKILSPSVYRKLSPIRQRRSLIIKNINVEADEGDDLDNKPAEEAGQNSQNESKKKQKAGKELDHEQLAPFEDTLTFSNSNGKIMQRKFIISFEYKDYLISDEGYWYLSLTLNQDLNSKKHYYNEPDESESHSQRVVEEKELLDQSNIIDKLDDKHKRTDDHLEDFNEADKSKEALSDKKSDDVISLRIPDKLRNSFTSEIKKSETQLPVISSLSPEQKDSQPKVVNREFTNAVRSKLFSPSPIRWHLQECSIQRRHFFARSAAAASISRLQTSRRCIAEHPQQSSRQLFAPGTTAGQELFGRSQV